MRNKYESTLHVTIKSILPPGSFEPGIRSLFTLNETNQEPDQHLNKETKSKDLDQYEEENKLAKTQSIYSSRKQSIEQADIQKTAIWSRVAGLPCRIPNDTALKLSSTKNGCYSIKFSASGSYLACACVEDNNVSPIYIYQIPSGKLVMKFQGHFGLIYEMNWSKQDKYIVTASNDATARIIDVENRAKEPFKLLPHPNFLYTAKFHPNSNEIVCTAGYDKVIRVWSIFNKKKIGQNYGQLLQELFGHNGFINSSCFSTDGMLMYSADSVGKILVWNTNLTSDSFSEWTLKGDISVDELEVFVCLQFFSFFFVHN